MLDKYDHNLLLGYVEGELSPGEQARVEAMLADDERLAGLLRSMIADRQTLRELPRESAPASLMEAVNLRLERRMLLDEPVPIEEAVRTHKTFRLHRALIYSGLAAMVLISAGVVVQTLVPLPGLGPIAPASPGPGPIVMRSHEKAAGDRLADVRRNGGDGSRASARVESSPAEAEPSVPTESLAMKGAAHDIERPERSMPSKAGPPPAAATAPPTSSLAMTQASEQAAFFARLVPAAHEQQQATAPAPTQPSQPLQQEFDWARVHERGPTHAAAQPQTAPVAVNIDTDDAALTQRELMAWAVDNGVRVLPTSRRGPEREADDGDVVADRVGKVAAPSAPDRTQARDTAAEQATEEVLVVVTGSQIPGLVEYLNSSERQLADVVPADGDEATAALERLAGQDEPLAPEQRRILATPPDRTHRLALDLSNGWAKLLQEQLPLSPRSVVFGTEDELILPVRINAGPSMSPLNVQQGADDPAAP